MLSASVVSSDELRLDHYERITTADGLGHSTVWDVHQDQRGYLWIATESHLQRYDGYSFRAFKHDPDDPESLSESQVVKIYETPSGELWFGTRGSGVNHYDRARQRFVRHLSDPNDTTRLTPGVVNTMVEDVDGALWIGTHEGLNRLDPSSGEIQRFRHDPDDPASLTHNVVFSVAVDGDGALWVGTFNGLDRLDRQSQTFVHHPHDPEDPGSLASDEFSDLLIDDLGTLWAATWEGTLHRLDRQPDGTPHRFIRHALLPPNPGLRRLRPGAGGRFWVLTASEGTYLFDPESERMTPVTPGRSADRFSLVYDIEEDRSGVAWFGANNGLGRWVRQRDQFEVIRHDPLEDSKGLPDPGVMALLESTSGHLWVGTLNRGLGRFDEQLVPASRGAAGQPEDWPYGSVHAMLEESTGRLWVGVRSGLLTHDPATGRIVPWDELSGMTIRTLLEDRAGHLWAGGVGGAYRISQDRQDLELFQYDLDAVDSRSINRIYAMLELEPGQLLLATEGGLNSLDVETGQFTLRRHDPDDPQTPSINNLVALHRAPDGLVWIGTYGGGLNAWDPATDRWQHFHERDGLPSDKVVAILDGDHGDLWLATNGGLSHFEPTTGIFRNYDVSDGLHGNVFFIGSAMKRSDGTLFFGGPEGVTHFRPALIGDDPNPPAVELTEFRIGGVVVPLGHEGADSPLHVAIGEAEVLTLDHRHRTFSLEFAALHFASPRKNRYAYRLEGYDETWIETGAQHRLARYTNLNPGHYTFRVRASNKDGSWNHEGASLDIRVLPPPWRTWWAYGLYALTLLGIVGAYTHWQHGRVERERRINERLREVDRLKDEFLANTSHELRTPLQGITGLAESLADGSRGQISDDARADLSLLVASGRRLTVLVDDILDLSKLQHASLELRRRPLDLRSATQIVTTLLRPLVTSDKLQLVNAVPDDLPPVHADEDRLQQILHNLVGNALEFTEAGRVEIRAAVEGGVVRTAVVDTGIGIPEDHLEVIFEAFRQVDSSITRSYGGTGLGLAVTRQLVELHGGALEVDSTPGEGSTFSFTLPIAAGTADDETPTVLAPSTLAPSAVDSERDGLVAHLPAPIEILSEGTEGTGFEPEGDTLRVLVVDDEPINRRVLENFLDSQRFDTTVAADGAEALRLIEEQAFDLVLLDIMMPKMSGYEVCETLRERHSIEELPIIFLTAKTQSTDIVTGLGLGANDYLTKPISKGELLARVRPHIDLLHVYRHLEDLVDEKVSQVKTLQGLLPICASCKKIREDDGYWSEVETFIDKHSDAKLSHGICPDCADEIYTRHRAELTGKA